MVRFANGNPPWLTCIVMGFEDVSVLVIISLCKMFISTELFKWNKERVKPNLPKAGYMIGKIPRKEPAGKVKEKRTRYKNKKFTN